MKLKITERFEQGFPNGSAVLNENDEVVVVTDEAVAAMDEEARAAFKKARGQVIDGTLQVDQAMAEKWLGLGLCEQAST